MALPIGTPAPNFELSSKTPTGLELVNLNTILASGKNVVLLFFPMAFTSVCTKEFCSTTQELDKYNQLDAVVLGISGDGPFAQEAWAIKEDISVQLLSDYEHDVAKSYDVAYDSFLPEHKLPMGGVPKRAAFVIDSTGVIRYSESAEDPHDLPDFVKIQQVLASLKA